MMKRKINITISNNSRIIKHTLINKKKRKNKERLRKKGKREVRVLEKPKRRRRETVSNF